jgi:hypothetical protein
VRLRGTADSYSIPHQHCPSQELPRETLGFAAEVCKIACVKFGGIEGNRAAITRLETSDIHGTPYLCVASKRPFMSPVNSRHNLCHKQKSSILARDEHQSARYSYLNTTIESSSAAFRAGARLAHPPLSWASLGIYYLSEVRGPFLTPLPTFLQREVAANATPTQRVIFCLGGSGSYDAPKGVFRPSKGCVNPANYFRMSMFSLRQCQLSGVLFD